MQWMMDSPMKIAFNIDLWNDSNKKAYVYYE